MCLFCYNFICLFYGQSTRRRDTCGASATVNRPVVCGTRTARAPDCVAGGSQPLRDDVWTDGRTSQWTSLDVSGDGTAGEIIPPTVTALTAIISLASDRAWPQPGRSLADLCGLLVTASTLPFFLSVQPHDFIYIIIVFVFHLLILHLNSPPSLQMNGTCVVSLVCMLIMTWFSNQFTLCLLMMFLPRHGVVCRCCSYHAMLFSRATIGHDDMKAQTSVPVGKLLL
ncbi:hypothetical protein ElyMa_005983900 [Elysia marginata]|uniref:Uncharacterized protein n=1 Tax=Elysia marginata TaxID=1093978 RepID=A0AAV4GEY6_9GAST|nr:hypothetical protein ElyMa_005983900 [Elysia marginata]